jgi:hypothetical protein
VDLTGIETKFWHGGMPRYDSFPQWLIKVLDRIPRSIAVTARP